MKNANEQHKIKLFEEQKVRTIWDEKNEEWYFSVIDIVAILIEKDYQSARKYWKVLKGRILNEGYSELVTNCYRLKLPAQDGKMRETDVADIKTIFRIIQSIPSKKAEPIKQWLAKVGSERLDEMQDPELAIDRAMKYYLAKGYSPEWINQRLKSIEIRKALTDEWQRSGVKDSQ